MTAQTAAAPSTQPALSDLDPGLFAHHRVRSRDGELRPFHPERIASRILGMGDVLSLIEEVERKVDRAKAEKLARKVEKGKTFDLQDLRDQLQQMRSMGGVANLLDKLPGMSQLPQAALAQLCLAAGLYAGPVPGDKPVSTRK